MLREIAQVNSMAYYYVMTELIVLQYGILILWLQSFEIKVKKETYFATNSACNCIIENMNPRCLQIKKDTSQNIIQETPDKIISFSKDTTRAIH